MQFTALFLAAATAALTCAQDIPDLADALNSTESLSTLNTLLGSYPELLATLANSTNITIFAPSNDALETLMAEDGFEEMAATPGWIEAVLQYHVVNASLTSENFTTIPVFFPTLQDNATYANVSAGQRIGLVLSSEDDDATAQVISGLGMSVNVSTADVEVSTGYVHIIDGVLTLPQTVSETASAANLTALAGALDLTDLTETVDTTEDLTIFAPITSAFEDIASVLADADEETVAGLLQYHVVAGQVAYSSTLEDGDELEALSGETLNITISEGEVFVNSARVIAANVLVANGVVHFIDAVLNPNSTNEADPDAPDDESSPVNFPDAEAGDLAFTADLPEATQTVSVITEVAVLPTTYTSAVTNTITETVSNGGAEATEASEDSAPLQTGAIGAAALFGGAVILANL